MSRSHCPRFDNGLEVQFGSISISKRGLKASARTGNRAISWAAIRSYAIREGTLTIQTTSDESFGVEMRRISNVVVLLHAFEQLAPNRRMGDRPRSPEATSVHELRPTSCSQDNLRRIGI